MTAIYVIIQFLALALYGLDKYQAVKKAWRIPEKVLLTFAILAPFGAYIGMFVFRHKTRKWYFWAVVILFLFIHFLLYYLYQILIKAPIAGI